MWLLAYILATLTQHNRQKMVLGVDFEWSSSLWVHNLFRVYELLFWRREGIRIETAANHTGQIAFTFEGQCALVETYLRSMLKRLKPRLVVIPQLQVAAYGAQFGLMPYRFAIAFDNAAAAGSPPKTATFTSLTLTTTGSNISVAHGGGMNATSTTSPTAKFNSVASTTGTITQNTTSWGFIFYNTGVAAGSSLVAEFDDSVSTEWAVNAVSLTGTTATPSSPGTAGAKATSTAPSVSVTTTQANSVICTAFWCTNGSAGTTTTGTGQTSRSTSQDADSGFSAAISTQTTTTAGAKTSGWTIASALWIIAGVEIQAGATASVNSGFFPWFNRRKG
jgi:hypothetical protein